MNTDFFFAFHTLYVFLLFLGFFFVLVRLVQLNRSRAYSAAVLLIDMTVFAYLQFALAGKKVLSGIPLAVLSAALGAVLGLFVLGLIHFRRSSLTAMSVKEACDGLSNGLCYYYEDGRILLLNETMNKINNALTGYDAINGVLLAARLKSASDGGVLKLDKEHIYFISDNAVTHGGERLLELIASDITAEYTLNDELNKKNQQLKARREHLLNYSRLVEEYTIEKETLQAKLSIHDNLGSLLLATRQYIRNPQSVDSDIDSMWEVNLSLLRNNGSPAEDTSYASIIKTASELGINVTVNGAFPENGEHAKIILYALRECITNAIRHAGASGLTLDIKDKSITLKNDGTPPKSEITEGGGLSNLRRYAEGCGCKMEITSLPEFELKIIFPEGVQDV